MKKILFLLTITASLFIIKDLLYSIYTLWSKKDLLVVAQKQVQKERREHMGLEIQLTEAAKQGYIEAQARNKLFLVKPGEQVVILSEGSKKQKSGTPVAIKPNWQQWLELFH